jgi:hypothetical protein
MAIASDTTNAETPTMTVAANALPTNQNDLCS